MVIETTRWSFKLVSRTDHHLGNIDWHANLGWHGNLDIYDNLGRLGSWDHRVKKLKLSFMFVWKTDHYLGYIDWHAR